MLKYMSVRETIRVAYPVNVERYVNVLKAEYGMKENVDEPESYLIGDPPLPFYKPLPMKDRSIAITGFNYKPLSALLVISLANHPDLVSAHSELSWSIEQELLYRGALQDWGKRIRPQPNTK